MEWYEITKTLESFNSTLHTINKQFDEINEQFKIMRNIMENKTSYFDYIISSTEKLAEKLIYKIKNDDFTGCYLPYFVSTIVEGKWTKKEDAIKATIEKLNEVQYE